MSNNDQQLADLLKANIEASNRTTYAVRAIVRYVFLQLTITTVCGVLYAVGAATNLNVVFVPISSIAWIAGTLYASFTARKELKASAVPKN